MSTSKWSLTKSPETKDEKAAEEVAEHFKNVFETLKSIANLLEPFVDDPKGKKILKRFSEVKNDDRLYSFASLMDKRDLFKLPFISIPNASKMAAQQFIILERYIPFWAAPILEAGKFALKNLDSRASPYKDELDFRKQNPIAYNFYAALKNLTLLSTELSESASSHKHRYRITQQVIHLGGLLKNLVWNQRTGAGTFSEIDIITMGNIKKQQSRLLRMMAIAELKTSSDIYEPLKQILSKPPLSSEIADKILDSKVFYQIKGSFRDTTIGQATLSVCIKNCDYKSMFSEIKNLFDKAQLRNTNRKDKEKAKKNANIITETVLVMLEDELSSFKRDTHFNLLKADELLHNISHLKSSAQKADPALLKEIDQLETNFNSIVTEQMNVALEASINQLREIFNQKNIEKGSDTEGFLAKAIMDLHRATLETKPEEILKLLDKADGYRPRNDATVKVFNDLKYNIYSLYLVRGTDPEALIKSMNEPIKYAKSELEEALAHTRSFRFRFRFRFFDYITRPKDTNEASKDLDILIKAAGKLDLLKEEDYNNGKAALQKLKANPELKKYTDTFILLENLFRLADELRKGTFPRISRASPR